MTKVLTRRSFLSGVFALGAAAGMGGLLIGCSSGQDAETPTTEPETPVEPVEPLEPVDTPAEPIEPVAAAGTLVVYFSAQGHTGRVAEILAERLNADVFVIEPQEPYTEGDLNWRDSSSRVNREHDDEAQQDIPLVQTEIPNLDTYATVLFGYPTWWQQASWVVRRVATGNDFTGKTVIPFTTSQSSPLGTSAENLAQLAGTGDWQEGRRFSENVSESDVIAWADSLQIQ